MPVRVLVQTCSIRPTTMATATIAEAIRTIPEKKEDLLRAFQILRSHSSLASFTLNWSDLDAYISAIEASIHERFKDLQAKEADRAAVASPEEKPSTVATAGEPPEADVMEPMPSPRPELVSLCGNMDGKGLRSFLSKTRSKAERISIQREIVALFLSLPNAALLVLDAVEDFFDLREKGDPLRAIWRGCIDLLERVKPTMDPLLRERAKELAMEWIGKIKDADAEDDLLEFPGSSLEERARNMSMEYKGITPMDTEGEMWAMLFLQLVASYGLSLDFKPDDILDAFTRISWGRKQAAVLYRKFGLTDRAPDFIQKLNDKKKQLDAVRFVYAFNLSDKFPPVPLLKAYLKEYSTLAKEVRRKGNNSIESQNVAIVKEHGALKSVLRAIVLHRLESDYPPEVLEKQLIKLEKRHLEVKNARGKFGKKRLAAAAAAGSVSNQKTQKGPQQQKKQSSKRSRLLTTSPTTAVVSHHPPLAFPPGFMVPYVGNAGAGPGPYQYHPAAIGPVYNHQGPHSWNPYWSG